jgi:phenylalanyl-tRNA synthetase beta chain
VFDVYRGKGVEEGKKSIALTVMIQSQDKTLTDKEIASIADKVVESVEKQTGGKLRA